MSPFESSPCQNSGSCHAIYETYDYRCKCKQYYFGTNCERQKALSCKERFYQGFHKSGVYPLSMDVGEVPVYCHMTLPACGEGQWTSVMKIDGAKDTFIYDSQLWNNMESIDIPGGCTGFDYQQTKLPTFWNTPLTQIFLRMRVKDEDRFITINLTASSLHSIFSTDQYLPTSLGRNVWKKVVGPQASLQHLCNMEGFNVVCSGAIKTRIGIITDDVLMVSPFTCVGCDSAITFGGDDFQVCGNNGYKDISAMGYILIK